MIAVLLVALAVAFGAAAAERWARVHRTRRQAVAVLAAVPELAGAARPGAAQRTSATAAAVATQLGLGRHQVRHVAAAARLRGLADLAPTRDPVAQARIVTAITTKSGLSPSVTSLVDEVLTTTRGRASRAAAAVRVAATFERTQAEPHVTTVGALFATVAAHGAGNDRRAAAALVALMRDRVLSA